VQVSMGGAGGEGEAENLRQTPAECRAPRGLDVTTLKS